MKDLKLLWELYITFLRIGAFTIGGGYAMISVIQKEMVEIKKWYTEEEMVECFALAQSVPGVIAVNTSTLVGYKMKKLSGAIIATAGMLSSSLIIIILIAAFFREYQELPIIQKLFKGILPGVVVVILMAVIKMGKKVLQGWKPVIIMSITLIGVTILGISPPWMILTGAILGIIFTYGGKKNEDTH